MGPCIALLTAHLAMTYHAGPANWYADVVKSSEYHACLVAHQCVPETILVESMRSKFKCRELVLSPGTENERRKVF